MECPRCKSSNTYKNGTDKRSGKQKYICSDCRKNFYGDLTLKTTPPVINGDKPNPKNNGVAKIPPTKIGMTLNEFRERHDVDYIVKKTLDKLRRDMIYEKSDIIKLTGLRAGYPGLSPTLESSDFKDYKGRAGGVTYWSHPETISELREQAKIT